VSTVGNTAGMPRDDRSNLRISLTRKQSLLSYRAIEPQDIPQICGFTLSETELFYLSPEVDYPLTPAQLRKTIRGRLEPTVVLDDREVVGFANLYKFRDGESCFIGNVVVRPDRRGRGVGAYLVETMLALAFGKHRFNEVRVSCFNGNTTALLLYAKLGFTPYAIEQRQDKRNNTVALIHLKITKC